MRVVSGLLVFVITVGAALADQARPAFGDELSREQFGRSRTIDVRHYRLDLELLPDQREVRGTTSVTLSPILDLTEVELDAGPMQIDEVSLNVVEGTEKLQFRHDGAKLRVQLPREFARGEALTLNVRYAARPRGGLYFVGPDEAYPDKPSQVWSQGEAEDNHQWFPSYDYPNDRATSEEIYTVPSSWTAIGNGELVGVRDNAADGTRSFHYRMNEDHVVYLISIVAGEFEKYTDEFDGIPVEYYVPPGTGRETAMRSFDRTPDMLRFFSEKTGVRYPYPKYSQACAVDFIFGGMENVSATTQTAETLHDERAALETDSLGLVAHEAAHQWWGNLLTCASWPNAWLNEGFATYWENLWKEHALGRDEFLYQMFRDRQSYLEEDRDDYRRSIVEHRFTDPMDLFDSHLYPKGAWVLHMLRGVLGDEAFFDAMAHYAGKHRGQVVETVDLRRAVAEATGRNLERFFDQWIHHGGHPELKLTRDWDADQRVLTLRFEQLQPVDELTPLFALPLEIVVDTERGSVHRRVEVDRTTRDVTLKLESEPLLVRVDPDFEILMELDHERSVDEMLRGLERDPNPIGRLFAARDLARNAAQDRAVVGLRKAVTGDAFYGVRIEAAKALGAVRGADARDALVSALGDDDARVRTAAAEALGKFDGDAVAVRALERILDSERAYGTYAAAVASLARIGAPKAEDVAREALKLDSHREWIRAAALEALSRVGGKASVETLIEWTDYGMPPRARTAAIEALPRAVPTAPDTKQQVERALIALLDDPYIWARRESIKALAELRVTDARERIERMSRVEFDSRLRREARRALRTMREAGAAGKTVEQLAAEVERLREEVRSHSSRLVEVEKQSP